MIRLLFKPRLEIDLLPVVGEKYPEATIEDSENPEYRYLVLPQHEVWTDDDLTFFTDLYETDQIGIWKVDR